MEAGWQQNLPREDGKCTKCNRSVAYEEFHFPFECFAYTDYRTKFVTRKCIEPPSRYMHIFFRFMSSTKQNKKRREEILALSKIVFYGNKKLRPTEDQRKRSLLLYEHFTCVKYIYSLLWVLLLFIGIFTHVVLLCCVIDFLVYCFKSSIPEGIKGVNILEY